MNATVTFIAALAVLPAVGLVAWAWFDMARVERELRTFSGFEARHFEIGRLAAENSEGARWSIPG